ncbi:MAG: DUF4115 domain-containing protein [Acidobacteriota bacterium]|nr:DUF4115 domain-containing protein [Acidobacteriota bacterium]
MASLGQRLRQAREARNITLHELAASTKIGTRTLQALEDERFDLLPGGIFNKGFIRSYAREVGLDEEEMVAAYMKATDAEPPETDMNTLATQVEAARGKPEGAGWSAANLAGAIAVLLAVVLGGIWLTQHRKEVREAESEADRHRTEQAAAQSSVPTPAPQAPATVTPSANSTPTDATPGAPAVPPAAAPVKPVNAGSPVRVEIKATARAWISVLRDDGPAETLTLDPANPEASARDYSASSRVKLIVGNPAGIEVTYNGKSLGPLGKPGQRMTIDFTPEGMSAH